MTALRRYLIGLATFMAGLALVGGTITAQAGFLFTDGDFDAQTLDTAVGAPWGPVGGLNIVTAEAQSPYVNVYPNNGKGDHYDASAANPYIVRTFTDQALPPEATGTYYFNLDFRNNSADAGDYSIVITAGAAGAVRSVALYVAGDALYAEGPQGTFETIMSPQVGTWYNLQLTLDLATRTYSGSVSTPGGAIPITSRPFVFANQTINCVYTDGGTSYIAGTAPDHDLDNFALSDLPFTPLASGAYVKSTAPVGKAVSSTAPIAIELQDHETTVVPSSIQLFLNGQAVTPTISKPADVTTITYTPPAPLRPATYIVRFIFADNANPPSSKTNEYSFTVPGPLVTSASPVGAGVKPTAPITVEIKDVNTQVDQSSIQLFLNDEAVQSTISKPAGSAVTTVTYSPPGGLAQKSTHNVRIIFSDNSTPPIFSTNEFSFQVVDALAAAAVVNIDFNGFRNNPGPDTLGPTYDGISAAGGGRFWNGITVDSRIPGSTTDDDDNLTVTGSNLSNSLGDPTTVSFTVSPMGGDATAVWSGGGGELLGTDPASASALLNDYIFNFSAGNTTAESPFQISGLGDVPFVDLYFYRGNGEVSVAGAIRSPFTPIGIFTVANTFFYSHVLVTNGVVEGLLGPGTAVVYGLSIAKPAPVPFVMSASPVGGGLQSDVSINVQLQDYVTQVIPGSVQLLVNGQAVTATVSKPAGSSATTISYSPSGGWAEGSTNTYTIVFGDSATPSVVQSNSYTFTVLSAATAAVTINIDINGMRYYPGPDPGGPTFVGQGAAGGGSVWNGILANSHLPDDTDDDGLVITGNNLLNSLGGATTTSFTLGPVGGDAGAVTPETDPTSSAALFGDYAFIGSAGQVTGLADFTIGGLGAAPMVDIYFYFAANGNFGVPESSPSPFTGSGLFTAANTRFFSRVPVTGGTVTGTMGIPPGGPNATVVLYGLTIQKPLPQPLITSFAPTVTPGFKLRTNDVGMITIQVQDYVSQVVAGSIQLSLNGTAVTPQVSKQGAVTTISFNPLGVLKLDADNTLRLVFSDNASPPVVQTKDYVIPVISEQMVAGIINIDFNGARTGDVLGPTYSGLSAASGGMVWNGITADSRLPDNKDEDNLTVGGTNLVNSLGNPTAVSFTVSPMGGDVGGAPTTDPTSSAALLSDYIFNLSAGNTTAQSPFKISGLGNASLVDLYFYRGNGELSVTGGTRATNFTARGIFTTANTYYYSNVPVTNGNVEGLLGPGTAVVNGMTIVILPTPPTLGPLKVAMEGGSVVISWTAAGTLQTADKVTGPWTDEAGVTSPVTVTSPTGSKFYRLRQ